MTVVSDSDPSIKCSAGIVSGAFLAGYLALILLAPEIALPILLGGAAIALTSDTLSTARNLARP